MQKNKKNSPIQWTASLPFFALWAVGIVGPFFTGISLASIIVAVVLYYVRMFFVTGFIHRYFSHRSFKANRFWQFIFALCGCTAVQNSVTWWASHHRNHHQHSDTEHDLHSSKWWGFIESHFVWFLRENSHPTDWRKIGDLKQFPELRLLDNRVIYLIPIILLGLACFLLGRFLGEEYGTSGMQMLIVGFFLSTFILHHGTFTINSISHMWGTKRYETGEGSLNNWFLAVFVTLGEGWHNNHHHQQHLVRQGHYWWEIDFTYYGIEILRLLRIARELRYK